MKRIKLTHGSARVDDNVSQKTIDALNELSKLAYNHETKQCDIQCVVESAISKDLKHSHFWIEDQELYESYNTIRGLRFRHRFSVAGLVDTDKCSEAMILYISKEYLD